MSYHFYTSTCMGSMEDYRDFKLVISTAQKFEDHNTIFPTEGAVNSSRIVQGLCIPGA